VFASKLELILKENLLGFRTRRIRCLCPKCGLNM